MITVASWNVLHRVHADNYASEIAANWPEETERIAAVTERVAQRSEKVIALQEVSGDQLASLRAALPASTFHTLLYPRVPNPRRIESVLADRSESLVLVVDGPSTKIGAEPFSNDPGKGVLAVEVDGLLVVATHVTGDRRRDRQFAHLATVAADAPAVLLGDFNVDRNAVGAALGEAFVVAGPPPDSRPTRPRSGEAKSQFIDHVVGHGILVRDMAVEDVAGTSDHNLVRAIVG